MRRVVFENEEDLLLELVRGNKLAFNSLFDTYHQLLASHIYRLTASLEIAEEVVQDVFLKIWMKPELVSDVRNIKAYLYTLSKNHAINYLKREAKLRQRQNEFKELNLLDQLPAESENLYLIIDEAVDKLPQQQKAVYLLSRHERLTYAQIASKMDISIETVKTYLKRATAAITSHIHQKVPGIIIQIIYWHLFFLNR